MPGIALVSLVNDKEILWCSYDEANWLIMKVTHVYTHTFADDLTCAHNSRESLFCEFVKPNSFHAKCPELLYMSM